MRLVRKLKLSKEGHVGSQMVWSRRWPAMSHFPFKQVLLGADLFGDGLPLGQATGFLFGDCLCLFEQTLPVWHISAKEARPFCQQLESKIAKSPATLRKPMNRKVLGSKTRFLIHSNVTCLRSYLGPGRMFRVKEVAYLKPSVCRFGLLKCLNLFVLTISLILNPLGCYMKT